MCVDQLKSDIFLFHYQPFCLISLSLSSVYQMAMVLLVMGKCNVVAI